MRLTVMTHVFGMPDGQRSVPVSVTVPPQGLNVRDLISRKIRQEITECVEGKRSGLSGETLSEEELLGGAPLPVHADAGKEVDRAHKAFAARGFMVVIDDRRVADCDDVLPVSPDSRVEFIKILPMVGG